MSRAGWGKRSFGASKLHIVWLKTRMAPRNPVHSYKMLIYHSSKGIKLGLLPYLQRAPEIRISGIRKAPRVICPRGPSAQQIYTDVHTNVLMVERRSAWSAKTCHCENAPQQPTEPKRARARAPSNFFTIFFRPFPPVSFLVEAFFAVCFVRAMVL